jgi:glycosyltransferase involved in cell wall biosynthesis
MITHHRRADAPQRLRVALLAGTLGNGGAEKQLVLLARTLLQANVDVRVYSLTRGEPNEGVLQEIGVKPIWVGRFSSHLLRLGHFSRELFAFRPHIVQATHFYATLYVTIAARLYGGMPIGALRGDAILDVRSVGIVGRPLLQMCPSIIANSFAAKRNASLYGVSSKKIHVLRNVVDLADFDLRSAVKPSLDFARRPVAIVVARLIPLKRLDRFLKALSITRRSVPDICGVIVGGGPAKLELDTLRQQLDLDSDCVRFIGHRDDVPAVLRQADMLVATSDQEGCPNVILEAMAARLPVITTPAGDASVLVKEGVTGYVVPFDDVPGIAARMIDLARSLDLRKQLGVAGRECIESLYGFEGFDKRIVGVYRDIAEQQGNQHVLKALSTFDDLPMS